MIFTQSDEPLDVTLLLFSGFSLLSFAATLDPMRGANRVLGRPAFRWKLVSMDGADAVASCGLPIPIDGAFDASGRQDALIVIAAFDVTSYATRKTLAALRAGAKRSAIVGGIESGPWLLGFAGLLDGRRATTHWEDLEDFAARFPNVDVRPDRWVVDKTVFTTGGATPALDCMLALIKARTGYSAALNVASLYIYEEARSGADVQPIVSLGRIRDHEPRVAEAIRIMETHIDQPLTISAIACRIGISPRGLEMLFLRVVNTSPGAYYLALRLHAARRLVLDTSLPVADIAVRTGFSAIASLSRAFRRQFGLSPSQARRSARS
ncbi:MULTISPECIES: GlxA family transcriptional regulator [Rhodomicrobium]|uniref:GlxA family transcriptional regulator n=1 Tax=Rhodomicrobium TaxID=1068 RepID=UPI000B4B97B9|nr:MULTISPECIES: GlxA family transcriptional regulator [Rhodomicrobium]